MNCSSYRIPLFSACLLGLSLAGPVHGQQPEQEQDSDVAQPAVGEWGGKVALGAIATGGNSETSTFNAEFGLSYDRGIWHNAFAASALQARAETTDASGVMQKDTTSERYQASLRSALDFSEHDYVFGLLEFEKDLFGGVRERSVQTVGYGRRLIKSESQQLDLELGAGARQLLAQETDAQRESELIGRGGLVYAWQLSESSRFGQKITVESGDANTSSESVTELKMAVIGGVFANLSFTWKNNSQVPAGTQNTDTISSVSLSYEF